MRAVSNKTRIETKIVLRDPSGRLLCMRAVSNKTRIETILLEPEKRRKK